ncbi:MAG: hypothetical protein AB7S26_16280 [Sandaracinaceae bacterium]
MAEALGGVNRDLRQVFSRKERWAEEEKISSGGDRSAVARSINESIDLFSNSYRFSSSGKN